MEAGNIVLGLVGKTNVGKSTFFAAATEVPVKIENRPFVTIEPNVGVGYARKRCAHVELGLPRCDPVNSLCIEGWRFIPVKLLDVAGLVPGAHRGRGLGNRFLDDVRKADALLLVVDASGSTDPEGVPVKPGSYDPVEEVGLMLGEIYEWMLQNLASDWERFARRVDTAGNIDLVTALSQRLSGFEIPRGVVAEVLEETGLGEKRLSSWGREDLRLFVKLVLERGKPAVIVANKVDVPGAEENVERLRSSYPGIPVVPASALAELMLRRLAREGRVRYIPGDPDFTVKDPGGLGGKALKALELVRERVMKRWGGTGVVQAINKAVFDVLDMIAVYPVEDPNRYTDREGRILPDVVLVKRGSTPRDLAYRIHTDLGKTFLYAVNAKTKQRVGEGYRLQDGDVVKIVAAAGKR
ncbi:redox-regulated ATPase YchF [Aeropyrum pernix]|uniref:redox-regulated ATPase YchF n=1 Tax=Aeropyrum pernix TaxID=56636 RepID=UPI001037BD7C|nr:redox-regulated ATPase YchF [Aeropyrum pernix]